MVRPYEQILQENLQRLRDLTEPSPARAALDQIEHVRRGQERARSLGFVFPDDLARPSPPVRAALDQMEHLRRSEERARSLGLLPEKSLIAEVWK